MYVQKTKCGSYNWDPELTTPSVKHGHKIQNVKPNKTTGSAENIGPPRVLISCGTF